MASSTSSGSVSQSGSSLRRSRVSVAAHRRDGGRTSLATTPRRRARVVAGAGSAGRYPSSRQGAARSGAVGGRRDRSDQLDPLRQIRTARPPRHASSSSGPGCPLTVWHEPDEPGTPSAQRRASSFVRFSPRNSSTFVVSRCHLLLLDPDATMGVDLRKTAVPAGQRTRRIAPKDFPYHGCALPTELGGQVTACS
jgi:hypothetical protein